MVTERLCIIIRQGILPGQQSLCKYQRLTLCSHFLPFVSFCWLKPQHSVLSLVWFQSFTNQEDHICLNNCWKISSCLSRGFFTEAFQTPVRSNIMTTCLIFCWSLLLPNALCILTVFYQNQHDLLQQLEQQHCSSYVQLLTSCINAPWPWPMTLHSSSLNHFW